MTFKTETLYNRRFKMRKVDTTITIGDKVKSFDFNHTDDCYVEGVVVGFKEMDGCERYIISMTKKVWHGKDTTDSYIEKTGNEKFFPPVNGTPSWGGETNCVSKI
jgi:hypothetical protein